MRKTTVDELLSLLDVRLDAFAMCEIDPSCGLACPPLDMIVVHFVIEGEGWIDCALGRFALRPGTVAIIPKHLAKTIEGPGPLLATTPLDQGCPLAPGMVRYRASAGGTPGLVLGCGSIAAGVGGAPGLFDPLVRPMIHHCESGPLPLLFGAMAEELKRPAAGTKAMVEALMKQTLVVVLREEAASRADESPLHLMQPDAQLGRAVAAIVAHPETPHSVDSLAAAAGMSRSCFNRQFAARFNLSPMEFVQGVRLRAAAQMLTASNLPVKAVAAAVGYASRSHFSRAFTEQFGLDPSRYRSGPVSAASAYSAAN
jgi:AraC-like DNA-binding protein